MPSPSLTCLCLAGLLPQGSPAANAGIAAAPLPAAVSPAGRPVRLAPEERRPVTDAELFVRDCRAFVDQLMKEIDVLPGLALSVVVDDQVVLADGYGLADREQGLAADGDSIFYIASATKPFTALLAMILSRRGDLDLQTVLADYVEPGLLDAALEPDQVQLRDLLCHTSGLQNGPITLRLAYTGDHDAATLWRLLAATRPNEAGRGHFEYTNYGYNLLTILMERELGVPWQDLLQQEVFTPLGLDHTSAYASAPRARGHVMAAPYDVLHPDGVKRLPLEKADAQMQSAGGMMISAKDAARWMLFQIHGGRLDGHQILDAAMVRRTQEPWCEVTGRPTGLFGATACGAGWMIGEDQGQRLLHHSGGYPGFSAYLSFQPDAAVGVTVLFNNGTIARGLTELIAGYAYDWWLGRDVAPYLARLPAAARRCDELRARYAEDLEQRGRRTWQLKHERSAYAGVYRNAELGDVEVRAVGDELQVRFGLLRATGEPYPDPDSCRLELIPGQGMVLRFEFGADGPPLAVRLDDDRFERVEAEDSRRP